MENTSLCANFHALKKCKKLYNRRLMVNVNVTQRRHGTLSFWSSPWRNSVMDFGVISAAYKITLKLKDLFTKRGKTTGIIIKHEAQEQGCLRMEKINKDYIYKRPTWKTFVNPSRCNTTPAYAARPESRRFRAIKLSRRVIVDVGGTYVTFHALNVRKNNNNNSSYRQLGLPVHWLYLEVRGLLTSFPGSFIFPSSNSGEMRDPGNVVRGSSERFVPESWGWGGEVIFEEGRRPTSFHATGFALNEI